MRLPLLLVLFMLLVLSYVTAIMYMATPVPPFVLGVPIALVAPQLVYYILRLGDALSMDPSFTRSCYVRESLMLINHARGWAHMCVFSLYV